MTDTAPAGNVPLQHLAILHALKRLMGRDPAINVTPFTEHQVVCYRTDVASLDVPEIHLATRQLIEDAVAQVQARQTAQIVLLSGDPGMGKSHLLNYFRRAETADRLGYLLVSPSNHWDIGDFEERLLDSLLSTLAHPSPDGPHPLLSRIEAIAFNALGQLIDQPGGVRSFRPADAGLFARLLSPFRKAYQDQMAGAFAARDAGVFRRLDFNKFTGYVCDRFLAEPGNPLHRYVLRVLLCYLFPEDRDFVLHWLRGKPTMGRFTKRFGVEEQIDRTYKRMDAVRLLMSLFAKDVTDGLSKSDRQGPTPQVFLLAFDQAEGRDELFASDKDWHTFFAELAELYNTLPNVLILFPMTTHLRDKLHPTMERQFHDRIRRDERFALKYIEDAELLALYRRRLERWIGPGEDDLKTCITAASQPYAPFDLPQVLELAKQKNLRDALAGFDKAFRDRLLAVATDIPNDYITWLRELRPQQSGDVYKDTEHHLATVERLLAELGATFAEAWGIVLDCVSRLEQGGLDCLELRFRHPADN
ncbi:MAG: ATP-binding protein, partial [Gemmataceae bacterium]